MQSLIMGGSLSIAKGFLNSTYGEEEDGEMDFEPSPAKRQKIEVINSVSFSLHNPVSSPSPRRKPLGHVSNKNGRLSRLAEKLQPAPQFYGRKEERIKRIVPPSPSKFRQILRVDITCIINTEPESASFMEDFQGPIRIQCRCSVSVCHKNDEISGPVKSKICRLKIELVNGKLTRELIFPEPYFFTDEEMYVPMEEFGPLGNVHNTCNFADDHFLEIVIEPYDCGRQMSWPPFDIPDQQDSMWHISHLIETGHVKKKDLRIFCQTPGLLQFDARTTDYEIQLGPRKGEQRQSTPYRLGLAFQWSLPSNLTPTLTSNRLDSPIASTPEKCITIKNDLSDPPSEKTEDKPFQSPGRAQRDRSTRPATYNVRAIFRQQRGLDHVSKGPKRTSKGGSKPEESMITYHLDEQVAFELGVQAKTEAYSMRCPFCQSDHVSFDRLRLHLRVDHDNYKFTVDLESRTFFFEPAVHISRSNVSLHRKDFQLYKPHSLFNFEKFLNGDDSWTNERFRSAEDSVRAVPLVTFSSTSTSVQGSRQSSPTTSSATDTVAVEPLKPLSDTRMPILVPRMVLRQKAFFDGITSRKLTPGAPLPSSDDEEDEGWIRQKLKDAIVDYSDIPKDEKDFIIRWNDYVMKERMSSDFYVTDMLLRFVEDNKIWLLEKPSRKAELGKRMDAFMMREAIKPAAYTTVDRILAAAEKKQGLKLESNLPTREDSLLSPPRYKSGCICGKTVPPGDRFVCIGRTCKIKYFHLACVRQFHRAGKGKNLLCADCSVRL